MQCFQLAACEFLHSVFLSVERNYPYKKQKSIDFYLTFDEVEVPNPQRSEDHNRALLCVV